MFLPLTRAEVFENRFGIDSFVQTGIQSCLRFNIALCRRVFDGPNESSPLLAVLSGQISDSRLKRAQKLYKLE